MPTTRQPAPRIIDRDGRATFVSHFLASHRAFRRDAARFPLALRRIGTDRAPDTDALCRHWADYHAALAHHHRMEDEQLFPALRQLDGTLDDVIDALVAQHEDLDGTIAGADELLNLLPSAEAAGPAALACEDLAAALEVHLTREEEHLVPVLRATRFEPGPGGPGETPEGRQPPHDDPLAFVLPWIADGLDHETVDALLSSGPPSMEAAFAGWRASYTDRLARWWS